MGNRRVPKNAIVLRGLVFKLGIRTIVGKVVEQNGAVCFASDSEQLYCLLPFRVPESVYNTSVEAWLRTYDHTLVFALGPDDLPVEGFEEDKRYFDVVSLEPLEELFERCLVKSVPKLFSCIRYAVWSFLVSVVLMALKIQAFPFVVIPLSLAVYCTAWAIRQYRMLNSRVIYDAFGNWINLSNGVTSLNNGDFQFSAKEK